MERYNKIYPQRKSAEMIASEFRKATGKPMNPEFVHWLAKKMDFHKHRYGKEVYYASNLRTVVDANYYTMYPIFLREKEQKKAESKPAPVDYNPDRFIEPAGRKDYAWESKIKRYIMEAIDELELLHGSPHEFDKFDFAYMSTGCGQQAFGYGAYLTTEYECAKEYAQGNFIYTVEIPDKKYLNGDRVSSSLAMKVARIFFKYYMTEDEYGSELYKGHENEFWNTECKYIGDSTDGNTLYGSVSSFLGSDKRTSEFFHDRLGYTGLVWTATNGSTGKKFKNYVIFDANDIKILRKEKLC